MAQTFYLGSTNSDLVGGADFNRYLESATEAGAFITLGVPLGTTDVSYGFTRAGIPGVKGASGDYTVEVEVTTGNNNVQISTQLHRVNSSGTVQNSSGTSSEQQATVGVKTFSFTAPALGTWAAGDRLRVDYRFRHAGGLGEQLVTIRTGTTDTEVVTPFVGAQSHQMML